MADRPILFSGPMVRALLEGRKTQTRRVLGSTAAIARESAWEAKRGDDGIWRLVADTPEVQGVLVPVVRFNQADRLYVREAWRAQQAFDDLSPTEIGQRFEDETGTAWCPVFYEADQRCDGSSAEIWQQSPPGKFRQGMHMPPITAKSAITAYGWLWNSINGERPGCHWQDNPWVVAVSFTVHRGNIDQMAEGG